MLHESAITTKHELEAIVLSAAHVGKMEVFYSNMKAIGIFDPDGNFMVLRQRK
jgi:hypothetical protein